MWVYCECLGVSCLVGRCRTVLRGLVLCALRSVFSSISGTGGFPWYNTGGQGHTPHRTETVLVQLIVWSRGFDTESLASDLVLFHKRQSSVALTAGVDLFCCHSPPEGSVAPELYSSICRVAPSCDLQIVSLSKYLQAHQGVRRGKYPPGLILSTSARQPPNHAGPWRFGE